MGTKEFEYFNMFITFLKTYYNGNFPKTVTELRKTAPSSYRKNKEKFNKRDSEILQLINPEYKPPKTTEQLVKDYEERLNLKCLILPKNSREKSKWKCGRCEYEFFTTLNSLRLCKYGCKKCANNLDLSKRKEDLDKIADTKNVTIIKYPKNNDDLISLKCEICGYEFERVTRKFQFDETVGKCPKHFSKSTKVVYEGIEFDSKFELECYKILQKFNPKIHVKYSDILQTDKNYEADFVISNDIIEVSNFKINYKNYFETIKIKNNIAENNGFSFYFLTSLKEVKEYAYKLEMKI